MNIIQKYIERSVWSVIFVLALSFIIHFYASELYFIDAQKKLILDKGDGVVTENKAFDENMSEKASYCELLGMMMSHLETDICIDNMYIRASTFSPYLFDFSVIREIDYFDKNYVYDQNGVVLYIDYNSSY